MRRLTALFPSEFLEERGVVEREANFRFPARHTRPTKRRAVNGKVTVHRQGERTTRYDSDSISRTRLSRGGR